MRLLRRSTTIMLSFGMPGISALVGATGRRVPSSVLHRLRRSMTVKRSKSKHQHASGGYCSYSARCVYSSTTEDIGHDDAVTILARTDAYVVVAKPPGVVCHHSQWTGSRAQQETPLLQRTRDAVGRRVNLVHRLDRGCSGCVLMAYADDTANDPAVAARPPSATAQLIGAMADTESNKTYIALVRGEGILHGRDYRREGWFRVDRPIMDERRRMNDATTWFRFVAGQDNDNGRRPDRARASLVLCRPETGRWHQVRRHLNGLAHPILGDSSHGSSTINREWRQRRGLPPERTCLHLARLRLRPTPACPEGINVECPLEDDMMLLLKQQLPQVLETSRPVLLEEGIHLPV